MSPFSVRRQSLTLLLVAAPFACGDELGVDDPCAAEPAAGSPAVRLLVRPFAGDFPTTNVFDHDLPAPYETGNGYQLSACGTSGPAYVDGHVGYDWVMPTGTALVAAVDGEVIWAGLEPEFTCPVRNGPVAGLVVQIRHATPGGEVLVVEYAHLDRVDVAVGQALTAGAPIGRSGNTGCSTEPHLHFAVWWQAGGSWVPVDPYGWRAPFPDPWAEHPAGRESPWLWMEGEAPGVTRR